MHRADLAKQFVCSAMERGYHVSIVDGGSPDEFLKAVHGYGASLLVDSHLNMMQSRLNAYHMACDTSRPVVNWSEPEKEPYVKEMHKPAKIILEGTSHLVLPKRKSLESYSEFQRGQEEIANRDWNILTGRDDDPWFGPRTASNAVMKKYFAAYDGKCNDQWVIYVPVLNAIKDGLFVASIYVDYTHPQIQTSDEKDDEQMKVKRVAQYGNYVRALERWSHENLLAKFR